MIDKNNRPFWRWTNVSRIVGGVMIAFGEILPKSLFSVIGVTFDSNVFQLSGVALLFYPMIFEMIKIYKEKA